MRTLVCPQLLLAFWLASAAGWACAAEVGIHELGWVSGPPFRQLHYRPGTQPIVVVDDLMGDLHYVDAARGEHRVVALSSQGVELQAGEVWMLGLDSRGRPVVECDVPELRDRLGALFCDDIQDGALELNETTALSLPACALCGTTPKRPAILFLRAAKDGSLASVTTSGAQRYVHIWLKRSGAYELGPCWPVAHVFRCWLVGDPPSGVVSVTLDGQIALWDIERRRTRWTAELRRALWQADFDPSTGTLVYLTADGQAWLARVNNSSLHDLWPVGVKPAVAIAVAGRQVLIATASGKIECYDSKQRQLAWRTSCARYDPTYVQPIPTGRLDEAYVLLAASGNVILKQLPSGAEPVRWKSELLGVYRALFRPDGRAIVWTGPDAWWPLGARFYGAAPRGLRRPIAVVNRMLYVRHREQLDRFDLTDATWSRCPLPPRRWPVPCDGSVSPSGRFVLLQSFSEQEEPWELWDLRERQKLGKVGTPGNNARGFFNRWVAWLDERLLVVAEAWCELIPKKGAPPPRKGLLDEAGMLYALGKTEAANKMLAPYLVRYPLDLRLLRIANGTLQVVWSMNGYPVSLRTATRFQTAPIAALDRRTFAIATGKSLYLAHLDEKTGRVHVYEVLRLRGIRAVLAAPPHSLLVVIREVDQKREQLMVWDDFSKRPTTYDVQGVVEAASLSADARYLAIRLLGEEYFRFYELAPRPD